MDWTRLKFESWKARNNSQNASQTYQKTTTTKKQRHSEISWNPAAAWKFHPWVSMPTVFNSFKWKLLWYQAGHALHEDYNYWWNSDYYLLPIYYKIRKETTHRLTKTSKNKLRQPVDNTRTVDNAVAYRKLLNIKRNIFLEHFNGNPSLSTDYRHYLLKAPKLYLT